MNFANSALETEELIELIFLHLDIRSLLVSVQRVSRKWHRVITDSVALQRHLYFLPAILPIRPETPLHRRLNPLLSELFPAWYQHASNPPTIFDKSELLRVVGWDEFSDKEKEDYKSGLRLHDKFTNARRLFSETPVYQAKAEDNPWQRAGATWRNMLVAQPPVTKLGIYQQGDYELLTATGRGWELIEYDSRSVHKNGQLSSDGRCTPTTDRISALSGLRMGHLYRESLKRLRGWEIAGFEILHGVQEVSPTVFSGRLGFMGHNAAEEGMEMQEAGAEVVMHVFRSMEGILTYVEALRLPFWKRCWDTTGPEQAAEEKTRLAQAVQCDVSWEEIKLAQMRGRQ
ncbi:hypothetical protein QQS21_010843 [Conoideocrella luteorostrata]|uniref:F-box domain-containing protein n=1 Tax=Conoideocrella luteorostrata TaxID=1105319 RepID=A0AAJ0CF87_9HYPO|nr:hypothetical protein QQS21_010843 [Conoideocrella luteorostrata]